MHLVRSFGGGRTSKKVFFPVFFYNPRYLIYLNLSPPILPQPTCLALPLEKAEDVPLPHGSLDIAHDGPRRRTPVLHARLGIYELDADLGDVAGVASPAEDAAHLRQLDVGSILGIIIFPDQNQDMLCGAKKRKRWREHS